MKAMVIKMIQLPRIDWFAQKNIYTGSEGTDPIKGCVGKKTLNFSVSVIADEDGKSTLSASVYVQLPFKDGGGRTNEETLVFPFDEEGKADLEAKLTELAKAIE